MWHHHASQEKAGHSKMLAHATNGIAQLYTKNNKHVDSKHFQKQFTMHPKDCNVSFQPTN
jgi:hypothetical protein